jgi:hypothetical protein
LRNRPLEHVEFPYVFADATYVKGRVNSRVVSRAVVVATGVTATGDREVLGVAVGDSEARGGLSRRAFWDTVQCAPAECRSPNRYVPFVVTPQVPPARLALISARARVTGGGAISSL